MAVERFPNLEHSVSYTTRAPREGEVDGVHYNFVDGSTFDDMESAGEFVESALVHGNRYGTSGSELRRLLKEGTDIMVEIDVQGAAQLREKFSEAVFIFIVPPSQEACRDRLTSRGKDTEEVIQKRLAKAKEETKEARNYDYIIINDVLDEAFDSFSSIIKAKMCKKERVIEQIEKLFDI
jgi:guanylate kinase